MQHTQTEQQKEAQGPTTAPLSCENCASFPVCTVFRAIEPMIKQAFTEKTKPFQASDLAKICSFFFSRSVAQIIAHAETNQTNQIQEKENNATAQE